MRDQFTTISVHPDLLPQVLRELFAMASDPNLVEVTDAEDGRVILAHPELAEAWYQQAVAKETKTTAEKAELAESTKVVAESNDAEKEVIAIATTSVEEAPPATPVKRGPGRPPKNSYPSASNGEEPQ